MNSWWLNGALEAGWGREDEGGGDGGKSQNPELNNAGNRRLTARNKGTVPILTISKG